MANGRLGTAVSSAGNDVDVYQVPASGVIVSAVTIAIVNRGTSDVTTRVAVSLTATPGLAEYIEYDMVIPANGVYERGVKLLSPGEHIIVHADRDDLSIRVDGLEKTTA